MIKMSIFNLIHLPLQQQTLVSFFLLVFLFYCQVSGGNTASVAESDLLNVNGKKQEDAHFTRNFAAEPLEIKQIRVYSKIGYRYGRTEVSSIVRNNDNAMTHEYNFTMRIPNNAFISNFSIKYDHETYHSFMEEKEISSCLYQSQKMRRQPAGLLEMDKDSKLFNVNVNIKHGREIEFFLKYDELIHWENGHYEYNIYMNQLQMKTAQNFIVALDLKDLYKINSLNIFNVKEKKVIIDDVQKEINGSSASLVWEPSANRSNYAKLISEDVLDQFLIYYNLQHERKPGEILLRDGYFVHTLHTENFPVLPKHIIFVLDISGSMEGEPLNQLQAAMKNIFDDLGQDDFFNIITFSSGVQNWSPLTGKCSRVVIPFNSTAIFKNLAIDFIDKLQVHGSTNIHDALLKALELWKVFGVKNKGSECSYPENYQQTNITPMIIFLTDGEPTSGIINHQQILRAVKIRNTEQIPIFSLAFGFEADFQFVKTLSLQNRGFSRQIFVGIESYLQLEKFYREISSPVLTNVTFVYASSVYTTSDISFNSFPTVNHGTEIQITGKVKPARYQITQIYEEDSLFNVSSSSSHNNPKVSNIPVYCTCGCQRSTEINSSEDRSELFLMNRCNEINDFFMERRWAYIHVMNLLSNDTAGSQEIRNKIIELSIKHHFVTPYTSLVVVKPSKNIILEVVDTDWFTSCKMNPNSNEVSKRRRKGLQSPNYTPTVGSTIRQLEGGSGKVNHYYLQSSNRGRNSTKKDYILSNLTWLENHRDIPIMRGKNVSEFYRIQKNYQRDESHSQSCYIRSSSTFGKCKPLQECIVAEFLTDFNIFLKSYFCPILNRHGRFIGTCCPN